MRIIQVCALNTAVLELKKTQNICNIYLLNYLAFDFTDRM